MKILVCYASTEGQTRKICRFCADQLIGMGHSVELLPAAEAEPLEPDRFGAVILAGSVHVGKLQSDLAEVATAHSAALNAMPTLLLVVSLAAAGTDADDKTGLDRIATDFCTQAGWTPGAVHHIAGAFRFTKYDFFKSWAMRYIASQYGQDVDPQEDREYTDWAALAGILKAWPALQGGPD